MTAGVPLDPADHAEGYRKWVEYIAHNHHAANPLTVETQQFTPLAKPLAESRVALVSSAGVHLDDQEPFHIATVAGDPSFRVLADDLDPGRLRFTHTHYDTKSAEADPNVVFPIDRLHEAVARRPHRLRLPGARGDDGVQPRSHPDRRGDRRRKWRPSWPGRAWTSWSWCPADRCATGRSAWFRVSSRVRG